MSRLEELELEAKKNFDFELIDKKTRGIRFIAHILLWFYSALVVMLGYNWLVPNMLNVQSINYIQAFMLDWLITFIVAQKITKETFEDSSWIYDLARIIGVFMIDTVVLFVLFILHFFI